MRSLPMILRLADDLRRMTVAGTPFRSVWEDPWMHPATFWNQFNRLAQYEDVQQQQRIGKNGYQVSMDVSQFKPEELKVKVVDNQVVVEGKHEEQKDEQGFISRHFVRRYTLPEGYDAEKVLSTLTSDGILTVSVPKPPIEEKPGREIPIQHVEGEAKKKETPAVEDGSKDYK